MGKEEEVCGAEVTGCEVGVWCGDAVAAMGSWFTCAEFSWSRVHRARLPS